LSIGTDGLAETMGTATGMKGLANSERSILD